eukprot:gene9588-biopygen18224
MLFFPREVGARWPALSSVSQSVSHRTPKIHREITGKSVVLAASAAGSGHSEPGPCPNRIIRKALKSLSSDASKERFSENSIFGGVPGQGLVPWPGGWWCLAGAQASAGSKRSP